MCIALHAHQHERDCGRIPASMDARCTPYISSCSHPSRPDGPAPEGLSGWIRGHEKVQLSLSQQGKKCILALYAPLLGPPFGPLLGPISIMGCTMHHGVFLPTPRPRDVHVHTLHGGPFRGPQRGVWKHPLKRVFI